MGSHSLLQGTFPDPGMEPGSPALQVDSLLSEPPGSPSTCFRGRKKAGLLSLEKAYRHSNNLDAWKTFFFFNLSEVGVAFPLASKKEKKEFCQALEPGAKISKWCVKPCRCPLSRLWEGAPGELAG